MGPILVESVPRGHVIRIALLAALGLALAAAIAPIRTTASQIAPSMQEASGTHARLLGPHHCGVRKPLAR